jgi:hypothetical protein
MRAGDTILYCDRLDAYPASIHTLDRSVPILPYNQVLYGYAVLLKLRTTSLRYCCLWRLT